jgi:hypothetical protein
MTQVVAASAEKVTVDLVEIRIGERCRRKISSR